ncbi:MAG: ParA family protein, partial [Proteobacteria bacterium]|nr:ParA family protein [Pseudomonadota bacterium]
MKTIAIINQKGSSGKTTSAVCLAAALAESGWRVLVVDLDAQASASAWLGIHDERNLLLDTLCGEGRLDDIIASTRVPGVDLVPASHALSGVDRALAAEVGAELLLRRSLEALPDGRYDLVLLDCPPSLGLLSISALAASDEVLVPVEAHVMALSGLAALTHTLDRVRSRLSPSARLSAILPCRVDMRKNLCLDVVASLRERFGDRVMATVVRENVRLAEAPSFAAPITVYDPRSAGAEDYRAAATEMLE